MDATIGPWFWWVVLLVMGASSVWRLIEAGRSGRIMLARGWGFARNAEPFEFWALALLYLIVAVGTVWMLSTGWGPL